MRCQAEILRHGYYTGQRCSRPATATVATASGPKCMCTQHGKGYPPVRPVNGG
jgi:hypothetical protein